MSGYDEEERVNHERWLVSYADFITLLFAFFVVMYAISSVNEGKYRVLSDSLDTVFNDPVTSIEPIKMENIANFLSNFKSHDKDPPINQKYNNPVEDQEYTVEIPLKLLSDEVKQKFKGFVNEGLISVDAQKDWLEIAIQSDVLFESGSARPSVRATTVLGNLTDLLSKLENPVKVEGFTDNVPIYNDLYESNWELSSARSAAIVQLLERLGIAKERLSAIGYGDNFPIADNRTRGGRLRNRRVILLVGDSDARVKDLRDRTYVDPAVEQQPAEPVETPAPTPPQTTTLSVEEAEQILPALIEEAPAPVEQETPTEQVVPQIEIQAPEGPYREEIQGIRQESGGLKFSADSVKKIPEEDPEGTFAEEQELDLLPADQ